MNYKTHYRYQQRIAELERENRMLRGLLIYRDVAIDIYDKVVELIGKNQTISMAWILTEFRRVLK